MKLSITIALVSLTLISCTPGSISPEECAAKLQTLLIEAEDGEVIELPEGTMKFTRSLLLDGKKNITIRGKGKGKSILSFAGQTEGAEGLKITAQGITLESFSVHDSKGDAIKIQNSKDVVLRDLEVAWTGGSKASNGAYGLYPVTCRRILIEDCEVYGASDAGIYVGQSREAVIRNNYAHHNVAGIEVENSSRTDVYGNRCENNAGGILVFDLPELPEKNGHHIRVFNNEVKNNNHVNFAAEGNTVALVPSGTGVLLMAMRNADIFDNRIEGHRSVGLAVVSYLITQRPYEDAQYNPFPSAVSIRDNSFAKAPAMPDTSRAMGKLIAMLFQAQPPDIIFDGMLDPAAIGEAGLNPDMRICVRNNGAATIANINAATGFKQVDRDLAAFDCSLNEPAPVRLDL